MPWAGETACRRIRTEARRAVWIDEATHLAVRDVAVTIKVIRRVPPREAHAARRRVHLGHDPSAQSDVAQRWRRVGAVGVGNPADADHVGDAAFPKPRLAKVGPGAAVRLARAIVRRGDLPVGRGVPANRATLPQAQRAIRNGRQGGPLRGKPLHSDALGSDGGWSDSGRVFDEQTAPNTAATQAQRDLVEALAKMHIQCAAC